MIETVRVSQKAKDQLVTLKRNTGINNWNVLCRWAFCESLAEPTIPQDVEVAADSSVEMTWKVFGGKYSELLLALLKVRCKNDGVGCDDQCLNQQFKLHLHRGISYLVAKVGEDKIIDLLK